jgi:alpha-D-ribose 1-methylphosphonate 5-triphosphate synthase subunit PhnG
LSEVFVKGKDEEKRKKRYHFLSDCLSRGQTITGEHLANYLSQLDRRQKKKKKRREMQLPSHRQLDFFFLSKLKIF